MTVLYLLSMISLFVPFNCMPDCKPDPLAYENNHRMVAFAKRPMYSHEETQQCDDKAKDIMIEKLVLLLMIKAAQRSDNPNKNPLNKLIEKRTAEGQSDSLTDPKNQQNSDNEPVEMITEKDLKHRLLSYINVLEWKNQQGTWHCCGKGNVNHLLYICYDCFGTPDRYGIVKFESNGKDIRGHREDRSDF